MASVIKLETGQIGVAESAGIAYVPIVRTGDLSGAVRIEYGVTADTATAGVDFTTSAGSQFLTMEAGQSRALVAIDLVNDALSESTETFAVSIINGEPLTPGDTVTLLAPRTTRVDILDDENPIADPWAPPLSSNYTVTEVPVLTEVAQPISIAWSPVANGPMYVASKEGMVWAYDPATNALLSTVLDLTAQTNSIQDRGLLDIALHPDLANSPYLYAFYVVDPPESAAASGYAGQDGAGNRYAHLVRYTLDAATNYTTVVAGSDVVMLGGAGQSLSDISGGGNIDSTTDITIPSSEIDPVTGLYKQDYIKVDSRSHAGGALAFGPDGALYVSIGDGVSFDQVDPRAASVQALDALSGKVLRVDPLTGDGLADNPFVQPGMDLDTNRAKVYQLGLRNPFTMAFADDGRLFISETGWLSWEEINSGGPGANFGWPYLEGGDNGVLLQTPAYRDLSTAAAFYAAVEAGIIVVTPGLRGFAHDYGLPGYQVQAIVGASNIYTGTTYPEQLQNSYFFTDVSEGEVFAVDINDPRNVTYLYSTPLGFGPVHFELGPDGYMYLADLVGSQITRLEIRLESNDANRPSPQSDHVTTVSGGSAQVFVLGNDFDPQGDIVALSGVTAPAHGTATINDNGTPTDASDDFVVYTAAAGFSGVDLFRYTVTDGLGTSTAAVSVVVTPQGVTSNLVSSENFEAGAIGWSDNTTTIGGTALSRFLGRFDGLPGGVETGKSFALPAGATVASVAFDFYEIDSWDGDVGDAFKVVINGVEILSEDFYHALRAGLDGKDPARSGTIGDISWTITPTSSGVTDLGFGTEWYQTDQIHRVTILVKNPGENLTVGFAAQLDNGLGDESFGIDNLTITAGVPDGSSNSPPVVVGDSATVLVGTATSIDVLANDSDADGDPLTITLVSAPQNGTAVIDANGTLLDPTDDRIVYTPNAGYIGTDAFNYTVSDGTAVNSAWVGVTVGPVTTGPVLVAFENFETGATGWSDNTTTVGTAALSRFLGRFDGLPGGLETEKTFVLPTGAIGATLEFDFYEIDSWDGDVGDAFKVFINGVEVISEDFYHALRAGRDGTDPARSGSAGNVSWTIAPVTDGTSDLGFGSEWYQTDQVHHVTLTVANPGASLKVGFGARLDNGLVDESFGIDNVRVLAETSGTPPNAAPVAVADAATSLVGAPVTVDVLANDTDADADPLSITAVTQPLHGTAVVDTNGTPANLADDRVTYTPTAGYSGTDTFGYTVSDGTASANGVVNMTVTSGSSGSQLIAFETFESGAAGWSDATTTVGGTSLTSFLGRFDGLPGGLETEKTYALPTSALGATLEFDFYEIDSWDGDQGDALKLYVNDMLIFSEQFYHHLRAGTDGGDPARSGITGGVTWSITPITSGATDLGFGSEWYNTDQIHHVVVSIDEPGTSLRIGFGAQLNNGLIDESYGIDNLRLTADLLTV